MGIFRIIDFLIPGFFVLILKEYFDLFLSNRSAHVKVQYLLWFAYWILDYIFTIFVKLSIPFSLIYTFFVMCLVCKIIYIDKIKTIVMAVLFILCIGCVSEVLIGFLFFAIEDGTIPNSILIGSIASKLLVLVIVRLIKLTKKQINYEYISLNLWLASISISLGSLYVIHLLYVTVKKYAAENIVELIFAMIFILLIDIISFKEFDKISNDAWIENINNLYKEQIRLLTIQDAERQEMFLSIQKNRHDFKNHLICINEYAQNQDYTRLIEYIQTLQNEDYNNIQKKIISGNSIIDVLVSYKIELAKKYNIQIETNIEIPEKMPYSDFDICVIITNSLDNAIEALKNFENRKIIRLVIKYTHSNLYICVSNPYIGEINTNSEGKLLTSKKNKSEHGIGITSIQKAVSNYNGLVKIHTNNGNFKIEAILYPN